MLPALFQCNAVASVRSRLLNSVAVAVVVVVVVVVH